MIEAGRLGAFVAFDFTDDFIPSSLHFLSGIFLRLGVLGNLGIDDSPVFGSPSTGRLLSSVGEFAVLSWLFCICGKMAGSLCNEVAVTTTFDLELLLALPSCVGDVFF